MIASASLQRVLPVVLAALAPALAPTLAQAALPPAGLHYKLNVRTSFEPNFTDCWTFSSNGTFINSPRLKNFPYQLTNLNTASGHFQAIWVGHVSIAFSGIANGTTLAGDGVDAVNRTYSYTGMQVSSCALAPTGKGFVTR